jgi:hypothetical protein
VNETNGVDPLLSKPVGEVIPAHEGENLSTTSGPSAVAATAVNSEDHEVRGGFFQRQSKRLTSTRAAIVLAFLLGVAGMGVLQSSGGRQFELDFIAQRLDASLSQWLAFGGQLLNAGSAAESGSLEGQNEANSQTTDRTAEVFQPVTQNTFQVSAGQNDENWGAKEHAATLPLTPPLSSVVGKQEGTAATGTPPGQGLQPEPVTFSQDGKGQRITVPHGATIFDLVSQAYGEQSSLPLDLVKEFNPHVNDLDKVSQGEQLWLPALTRETLLRQQPDASYHLILSSFRQLGDAERLIRAVGRKGYRAIITPQRVSASILLHRVEITNLQGAAAIEQALKLVNAQHSVAAARPISGKILTAKKVDP